MNGLPLTECTPDRSILVIYEFANYTFRGQRPTGDFLPSFRSKVEAPAL